MSAQSLLNVATRAVRAASRILFRHFDKLEDTSLKMTRRLSLARKIESEVTQELIQQIQYLYRDHEVCLAKDQADRPLVEHRWVIDAIDSFSNFQRGLPHFAMTLAYQHNGVTQIGVIHNPIQDETFSATVGQGALLGQKRIRCNEHIKHVNEALFGSSCHQTDKQSQRIASSINNLINKHTAGSYCSGSDSLDIAYVAAGRLDGFWALRSQISDLSAALLIAKEARAVSTSLKGDDASGLSADLLISHPKLHKQTVKLLHEL
jgi:myo-inositol-1(or 4)-monophosphatase